MLCSNLLQGVVTGGKSRLYNEMVARDHVGESVIYMDKAADPVVVTVSLREVISYLPDLVASLLHLTL